MNLSNELDYSLDLCCERIGFVSGIIEENLESVVLNDTSISKVSDKITYMLEKLGTYIIQSKDIKSERKVENSFYRTEKNYRQSKIGKETDTVDFELREDLHSFTEQEVETTYSQEYLCKLFNFDTMSEKEKYRVVKFGLPEKDGDTQLAPTFSYIYELLIENCDGKTDRRIIDCLVHNLSQNEIGAELSMSQQAVYKRIRKIIKKSF